MRLLELPDEVLAMLESGELSEGHGRAVLQAGDHNSRRRVAREARERAGTASELDVKTARIDALLEQEQAARLKHDLELARQRLRNM